MERTHYLQELESVDAGPGGTVLALVEPGYPDATEARKHLNALMPGTYHIATFVEANIVIEPPLMPTANVVVRGKTFVSRKPKATADSKPDGKAAKK